MTDIMNVASLPIIVTIVYALIEGFKTIVKGSEKWLKFIPLISGGLGAVLGLILFFAFPETIPADNVLYALMIGTASGLSATGANQIFKQLTKPTTPNEGDNK